MLPAKPSKGKAATSEPLEVFDDKIDLHGLPNTKELPDAIACHIMVERVTPQAWTNIIKSMSLEKLLDLYDNGYTCQAVVDNHLNDRVRDLIRVYKETKKELGLVTSREAELKAKYDGVVMGVDENPIVVGLQEEVKSLEGQLKDHEADYGRLLLEERNYEEENRWSEVAMQNAYKCKIGLSVSKAGNAYVTAEYPFLVEATRDPSTALEDLLSKKPRSLNPPHSNQEAFTFKPQSSAPITITEKLVSSNCTPEKTTDNA
ncbi:hypothetical protein Tco_0816427 [Tanacetum coccineum]